MDWCRSTTTSDLGLRRSSQRWSQLRSGCLKACMKSLSARYQNKTRWLGGYPATDFHAMAAMADIVLTKSHVLHKRRPSLAERVFRSVPPGTAQHHLVRAKTHPAHRAPGASPRSAKRAYDRPKVFPPPRQ